MFANILGNARFQTTVGRLSRMLIAAITVSTLALLCGCDNKDDELQPVEVQRMVNDPSVFKRDRSMDDITGSVTVGSDTKPAGIAKVGSTTTTPLTAALSDSSGEAPGFRGADADFVELADIYWKFNWIRKAILHPPLPSNLADAVDKTRKALYSRPTKRDSNFLLAEHILDNLEDGIKHMQAFQTLQASQPTTLIPWGTGSSGVQRFLDRGGLGFGAKQSGKASDTRFTLELDSGDLSDTTASGGSYIVPLTFSQKQCLEIVIRYETQYHASPEEMMKREWREAITKIDKLRAILSRLNRETYNIDESEHPASTDNGGPAGTRPKDIFAAPDDIGSTGGEIGRPDPDPVFATHR